MIIFSAFFGGKESGEKETAVLARAVANSYRGLAKISETTGCLNGVRNFFTLARWN